MKDKSVIVPPRKELEIELKRIRYRENYMKTFKSTVYILVTVAAIAIIIATMLLPVLRIFGTSMSPSLQDGDIIVAMKGSEFEKSDLIAFYYNNKILVKRVIANAGDWVDIDEAGVVKVNGVEIDEPYLDDRALGECDIELPYQVPEGRIFVMGDHRSISIDSRHTSLGCVADEQIVGKLLFRIWPLTEIKAF
ncbi:MAG: signal peptidase I [Paludibacteraceae bacterium]|jgi:signal peptidase I|nr:signal peptidase I [Paludibacteraceae bacterium]